MIRDAIAEQTLKVASIAVALIALLFSFVLGYENAIGPCLLISLVLMFAVPVALGSERDDSVKEQLSSVYAIMVTAMMTVVIFTGIFTDIPSKNLALISVAICGVPIIFGAILAVLFERDITADVLVSIAIVACLIIGEYEAAAEVAIIMQIGSFLEESTVSIARKRISHLHDFDNAIVKRIDNGFVHNVPVEVLEAGNIIRVCPGDIIPVDGVIIEGTTSIDTSSVTGESIPCDAGVGTEVMSGTVNMYGSVDIRVTSKVEDSTVSRMAKLLDEADANKAHIVRVADRWASVIVVLALAISVLTYVFTKDLNRAVTVLVVFCPCALILATPTAIMAAAGNMSHHGILVKDAGAIERMAKVDTFLFDKTGTLTTGNVECCGFETADPSVSAEELAAMVSAVEAHSEHPLGVALSRYAEAAGSAEEFVYSPGQGVRGAVQGKQVFAGNRKYISECCPNGFEAVERLADLAEKDGYHAVLAGIDGKAVGIALLSDRVKETSAYAVRHLWMLGMQRILITGDSQERAVRMRDELKMDDVVWECLPSDKLRVVSKIDGNGRACMVGDGINDAPSLKRAGVGIAMGGVGSDLAIDSSDFVFMNDNLSKIPPLVTLCRRTLKTIHLGIAFSLAVNLAATILAVTGYLGPVGGALVHNIGSVIVILAAGMVLAYNPWRAGRHKRNVSALENSSKD